MYNKFFNNKRNASIFRPDNICVGNIIIGLGAGTITALGKELEGAKSKSQLLLG